MIPREVLTQMATIGLTADQAAAVADMLSAVEAATKTESEAVVERSRAKTRERVAKWREAHPGNVTKRSETLPDVTYGSRDRVTRVEDNNSTQRTTKTKKERTREDDLASFKAELADLDTDRLEDLVKHRRRKNGGLTAHAARLFRKDAAACSLSLPEAVDACISRNWITVKPEYFRGRSQAPPGQQQRPPQMADIAKMFGQQVAQNGQRESDEDGGGFGKVVPYLPAVGSR